MRDILLYTLRSDVTLIGWVNLRNKQFSIKKSVLCMFQVFTNWCLQFDCRTSGKNGWYLGVNAETWHVYRHRHYWLNYPHPGCPTDHLFRFYEEESIYLYQRPERRTNDCTWYCFQVNIRQPEIEIIQELVRFTFHRRRYTLIDFIQGALWSKKISSSFQ